MPRSAPASRQRAVLTPRLGALASRAVLTPHLGTLASRAARAPRLGTLVLALALAWMSVPTASAQLFDVGIDVFEEHEDNAVPGVFGVEVSLTGDILAPTAQHDTLWPDPLPMFLEGGAWQLEAADVPVFPSNSIFRFQWDLPGGGSDSAQIPFLFPPSVQLLEVTYPAPASTGVPPKVVFTWDPAGLSTPGNTLVVKLRNATTQAQLFNEELTSPFPAEWPSSVVLDANTAYEFEIEYWTITEPLGELTTPGGDDFFYEVEYGTTNKVSFQTCAGLQGLVVPVSALVDGGAGPGLTSLGTIDVTTTASEKIEAVFTLDPAIAALDDVYDFRWINVVDEVVAVPNDCGQMVPFQIGECSETVFVACGAQLEAACLGPIPAIDPAYGTNVGDTTIPFNDPAPFYFTDQQVQACLARPNPDPICEDGVFVRFWDSPFNTVYSSLHFDTYLVATSAFDPAFPPSSFCVLAGFEWLWSDTDNQARICGVIPADAAAVDLALGQTGDFPFWQATSGCVLSPFGLANLGSGLAGTNGVPSLLATGALSAGSPLTLSLSGALADATANLVAGVTLLDAPFKGGIMVPKPEFVIPSTTDANGELQLGTTWPANSPPGVTVYLQFWVDDPGGPQGFSASNAVTGTTP